MALYFIYQLTVEFTHNSSHALAALGDDAVAIFVAAAVVKAVDEGEK